MPGRVGMKREGAWTGEDVMKKEEKGVGREREREGEGDGETGRGREGGSGGRRKEGRKSKPRPPAEKLSSQSPRVSMERGSCTAWPHG